MPPSFPNLNYRSSSSESFCVTSGSDNDFDLQAIPSDQLILDTKQTLKKQPQFSTMADPTIHNIDQTCSESEYLMNAANIFDSTPKLKQGQEDPRRAPPALPRPVSWTTITHPKIFQKYIKAEWLGRQPSSGYTMESTTTEQTEQDTAAQEQEPEALSKNIPNIKQVNVANTSKANVVDNVEFSWVTDDIFPDRYLPVPFNRDLVEVSHIWQARDDGEVNDCTFSTNIDTSSEEKAAQWLNDTARSLGVIHKIHPSNDQYRVFDYRGHNKPLSGGHIKRKPDIVLVDRAIAERLPGGHRVRWPVVQAVIEVSLVNNHQTFMVQTLLSKASVIFESQLHRRFVLGLAFFGKGDNVKYFIMLIDRAGGICIKPQPIKGYAAIHLARIIFAFAYACDQRLGADDRISINRLTGHPIQVVVEEQVFTIVQELHVSPYLFSRGTRVYIVKDAHGHFHIFKDSWIQAAHKSSEIEHIKKYSDAAMAEDSTDIRSQFLMPRFVAGENRADHTHKCRGYTSVKSPGRIRRRIITGPIGDPITSYRSRVECLQAFIDIVNQLEFLHDKCGLIHGDISINNVVIVRFLPSILAASHAARHKLSSPTDTAIEALPNRSPSSELPQASSTSTTPAPNPANDGALLYGTEENTLLTWEATKAADNNGLLCSLGSGGSVIDFDYSCPVNTASLKTSGTMPFKSLQLMNPSAPIEHRLDHDLESVLMVLLYIFRFTCGPTGDPAKEVKPDFNISMWYHESDVQLVRERKQLDIHNISLNPTQFITAYWAPISDLIVKLIGIIYGPNHQFTLESTGPGTATCEAFNAILTEARDRCKKLDAKESPPNYAAILPANLKHTIPAQDRGKIKQLRPSPLSDVSAPATSADVSAPATNASTGRGRGQRVSSRSRPSTKIQKV